MWDAKRTTADLVSRMGELTTDEAAPDIAAKDSSKETFHEKSAAKFVRNQEAYDAREQQSHTNNDAITLLIRQVTDMFNAKAQAAADMIRKQEAEAQAAADALAVDNAYRERKLEESRMNNDFNAAMGR